MHDTCSAALQPAPYHAFSEEVAFLETQFGQLNGSAYVMGDALHGLQWHIYAAGGPERQTRCSRQAQASIEVCMTHLCPNKVGSVHPLYSAHRVPAAACYAAAAPWRLVWVQPARRPVGCAIKMCSPGFLGRL